MSSSVIIIFAVMIFSIIKCNKVNRRVTYYNRIVENQIEKQLENETDTTAWGLGSGPM